MKSPTQCSLLLGLGVALLSCGGGRQLTGITLSPATADAQNFAGGQVPFTATGTFNQPPSPEPLDATSVIWCIGDTTGNCAGNIPIRVAVQNGLAECDQGFSGTVTILAGTQPMMMNPDEGSKLKIFGSAQLSCP